MPVENIMSDKQYNKDPERREPEYGSLQEGEDDLVDNQNYLVTALYEPFCIAWKSLYETKKMELDVPEETPFCVVLHLKYAEFIDPLDDLNRASFYMGIKDPQSSYKEAIEFGLYMGRLYFNTIFDTVNLKKEDLTDGINIMLTVKPGAEKRSDVHLTAFDHTGTKLSAMKISKMSNSAWNGKISTGAHIKSVRIEGFKPKY
jgi:hypothetical protein